MSELSDVLEIRLKNISAFSREVKSSCLLDVQVLDGGEVAEFDEPHLLLQKHHGWFSSMVDASKFHEASSLRNLALKVSRRFYFVNIF